MNGRVEPNPIMPVGNNGRTTDPGESADRALGKAEEIKQRAQSMAQERKERIAQGIDSVGAAFRRTGEQLRDEDQGAISQYVELLGDRVSRAARYLRERDPRELTYEVESFARRQPAVFLGGAFALGLLAARFLKSSAERMRTDVTDVPEPDLYGGYGSYGGGMPPQS